ncbi:EMG1/NEP1 methyltransferase [Hamiltosporidium magnivora]|uniref:EMG1/NEP1 methyltransferase n=1 Tax=Hamiltosporidium magnivora TaxID=148818 RepID=A0A4V2JTJ3_9MICR|nr:EMG1/NEP1 methyltransferase [Hamiltosporidium magnivora]
MEKIIFVLEDAHFVSRKNKQKKNTKASIKNNEDRINNRSDITHQCLLSLLDSPLNKAGKLKIYIKTVQNVLIDVNSEIRIPRSLNRFNGLMDELLKRMKIKSENGKILLKVIKNPVTEYLPPNIIKIGLSQHGKQLEKDKIIDKLENGYCFFVKAIPSGKDDFEFAEFFLKISDYSLSASVTVSKICHLFEELLQIF